MAIMLFRVSTSGKPVCKFVYVNNANTLTASVPPVLHHFWDVADDWSSFHCW